MINLSSLRQVAVSSVGALVLATGATALATAPARASVVAPVTVPAWQANVNRAIDTELRVPAAGMDDLHVATIAVRFDDAGKFADAAVVRPSGDPAVDVEALRAARRVSYPLLPAGAPRTVTMRLFFGPNADTASAELARAQVASR